MAVYFIRDAERPEVKIGYSYSPTTRMKALQHNHPRPLQLLKTIYGFRAEEAALHRKFKQYRLHGEWFQLSDELVRFIGRRRPVKVPPRKPLMEVLRDTIRDMLAAKKTKEQVASVLMMTVGGIDEVLSTKTET